MRQPEKLGRWLETQAFVAFKLYVALKQMNWGEIWLDKENYCIRKRKQSGIIF